MVINVVLFIELFYYCSMLSSQNIEICSIDRRVCGISAWWDFFRQLKIPNSSCDDSVFCIGVL